MTISVCTVIIVTHNSEKHLQKALLCLRQQTTSVARIVVVDSGSDDTSYLKPLENDPLIEVYLAGKDIGFCRGNNIGMEHLHPNTQFVLFLNPDAFLTTSFIEEGVVFMSKVENKSCGVITGTLLGYDIEKNQPTGKYDSTGIFRRWYGQWYDRGQGMKYDPTRYAKQMEVPAVCGAVMFCRKEALDSVLINDGEVFDSGFFMYKEDIDLSVRLRRKGWTIKFLPYLLAYHCRGWNRDRSQMPRKDRLQSAKNELKIHSRSLSPIATLYSLAKYATVKFLNR